MQNKSQNAKLSILQWLQITYCGVYLILLSDRRGDAADYSYPLVELVELELVRLRESLR